jgi:hypothetical protein
VRLIIAAAIGRIETTIGPEKGPAGLVEMVVRNIGTVQPIS